MSTATPQAPITAATAMDGLRAVSLLARLHRRPCEPEGLRHRLALDPSKPADATDLRRAAREAGLKARWTTTTVDRLALTPLPALAWMADGRLAVLAQCDGQRVLLQTVGGDPSTSRPMIEPLDRFAATWSGRLMLVSSPASLTGELARFDFSWFIPSLVKHRRLLAEVLAVSLLLQGLALATPVIFQVVMDKVLVHQGLATLNVLAVALLAVVVFESVLSALRGYVFSHTASRIDAELGSRLYRHLLQLPLAWFEARRAGDTVARVRELESIRAFLTGQALTLVLDVLFSAVFLAAMWWYSPTLTLIVAASLPVVAGITLLTAPVLRRRLDEQFARNAECQSLLVETVTAVPTVKAGALEPQMAQHWDDHLAGHLRAGSRARHLGMLAHEGVNLTTKVAGVAVLWMGAHQVMGQQMTVGMFVAFTMFAARVTQPVLRMAQMATEFQQVGLAVRRVGDVLNAPTEVPPAAGASLPQLHGRITLENVSFRYRPDAPLALDAVSLDIRPGEVVGIVGRSGSGKSTVARLLQRLHVAEQGRVRIDGIDIGALDPAPLRRQVGVVLQDGQLFHRSVRDNIAIADPGAPLEAVIRAATLAGAHDFISELPQGYDTVVGEHGVGLSGGQRQRIAIARALFGDPRVLVFDEATSALDYESEAVVQRNMAAICRGRTVIVIAHRLSAVRRADRIVVLDRGRVVESGPHEALLRHRGLYARLWALQQGDLQDGNASEATSGRAA